MSAEAAPEDRAGFWHEFVAGLRTIVTTKVVLALLVMGMIANVFAQTFNALGVFFVTDNLQTDAEFFGLQDMVMGIGVVVGAAAAGWAGTRLGLGRTVWLSMLGFGVLFAAYARTTHFVVALGVLLLAAVLLGSLNTPLSPLLMREVPRRLLGRVFGTFVPVVQSTGILGVAVAGWASSSVLHDLDAEVLGIRFGTYDTIFLAGAVLVIVSGLFGMVALRGVDSGPAAEVDAPVAEVDAPAVEVDETQGAAEGREERDGAPAP